MIAVFNGDIKPIRPSRLYSNLSDACTSIIATSESNPRIPILNDKIEEERISFLIKVASSDLPRSLNLCHQLEINEELFYLRYSLHLYQLGDEIAGDEISMRVRNRTLLGKLFDDSLCIWFLFLNEYPMYLF